ncbi:hypothetical protein RHSIM_Rhsim01G0254600 [Rhododendron simsii]|uniref:Integrase catalytic domain-containing protein n=1 Tax=Rhododendron simsii TaxID=118357 RepID=A0A834LXE2_RHOSS|nr:hypothetical protein RHSIM_Rhsim01G0254600 [Rhododendron simsii]
MPLKHLTQKEMEARREKGLCFNCDEKFVKGHRCQRTQLHLIIGEEAEDDTGQEVQSVEEAVLEEEVHISVHALFGSSSFRTMRWLGQSRDMKSPFSLIRAVPTTSSTLSKAEQASQKQMDKSLQQIQQGYSVHLYSLERGSSEKGEVSPDLNSILTEFSDVFNEPKHLPPIRPCDHMIQLKPGSAPIQSSLEYLGHKIFDRGVSADPVKVVAMKNWPRPTNLKSLRGFLGLTGYYRRFVQNYGNICQPLTDVLIKDAFLWTETADQAFETLREAMASTPVLALPKHLDHLSLKYLLDQKTSTIMQQKWLTKLLGYDYEIMFKAGYDNKVADALSRLGDESNSSAATLTAVQTDWLTVLKQAWHTDENLKQLIADLMDDPTNHEGYTWANGLLTYKGRLVVGSEKDLRFLIMKCMAHPEDTLEWKRLIEGLRGLPASQGKSVILVVVDRLSKYVHFMALSHPYTALDVARVFLETVFKLHGMPTSIVSDRDVVFISSFWQELFRLQGTTLNLSTAYHPQTDGQTEVVNRCLECYLRCMIGDRPKAWVQWLSLAEWWFNTTYHSASHLTPYQVVYGQVPPSHIHYILGSSNIAAIDQWGQDRKATLRLLKEHLTQAQNRMKQQADKHRTERVFEVGGWVYLRLQPYKQTSLQVRSNVKLAPRFYGPFQVLKKIGHVVYHLNLPPHSKLHPVFHVSLLKKRLGTSVTA